jgi:hypothetical protein
MSNEVKSAPAHDPNVRMVADIMAKTMVFKTLPAVTLTEIAQLIIGAMEMEAGKHEPFRIGNTYQTQDGRLVTMMGYGTEEHIGTTYETMYDQHGHHRYTNRPGYESGRLTGTNTEFNEGGNIQPLYPRPPKYAVPAMTLMVPEGYQILKMTTHEQRSYPNGHNQYHNTCIDCGRDYLGPKMSRVCNVCVNEVEAPLIPTAVWPEQDGLAFKVGHFNIFTDVKNDPEHKGRASVGYGSRLVYKEPKRPEKMTNYELNVEIARLQKILGDRLEKADVKHTVVTEAGEKLMREAETRFYDPKRFYEEPSSAPLDGSHGMPT